MLARAATGGKLAVPSFAAGREPTPAAAWIQEGQTFHFDIAEGLLGTALPEFERISGLHVMLSKSGIENLLSPGARGEHTAAKALEQVLADTGVMFRYSASNTVTLDLIPISETVDVTTNAPGILISSPKYTEPLSNVPQTIEVIPREVMAQQGVTTLSEVLRNVPGITLQAGEGGASS